MRLKFAILVTAVLLADCVAQKDGFSGRTQTFKSPDGAVVAEIHFIRPPVGTSESRVVLRAQNGAVLAKHDYSSEDGEHGYGVTKAAWTPDSKFFVYSLESSGGHSPWHSPVQFFSRPDNKIRSLDDALCDAVMNPKFETSAPDIVTVELYFSKQTRTVSLHQLVHRSPQQK